MLIFEDNPKTPSALEITMCRHLTGVLYALRVSHSPGLHPWATVVATPPAFGPACPVEFVGSLGTNAKCKHQALCRVDAEEHEKESGGNNSKRRRRDPT